MSLPKAVQQFARICATTLITLLVLAAAFVLLIDAFR